MRSATTSLRRWMENSLLYSLSATAITLATGIPAGYGLALGTFRGRNLILRLTLVAMLMPASSLVLPIYLELNAMRLIGNMFSIILPFAFFPFGVFLAYIYYSTARSRAGAAASTMLPRDAQRVLNGCTSSILSGASSATPS